MMLYLIIIGQLLLIKLQKNNKEKLIKKIESEAIHNQGCQ